MTFHFGAIAGVTAGILDFVSYSFYIIAVVRGRTRPNRASWFIWTVSGVVIGASYYFTGASQTMWVAVSEVIGPLLVFILSLRYGMGGWTKLDRWSLAGAGISLILWTLSGSALLALVFNLAVDFFGAIPTIIKSYQAPKEEDLPAWGFVFGANVLNIFAAETRAFNILVHPVYGTLVNAAICGSILFGRLKKRIMAPQSRTL